MKADLLKIDIENLSKFGDRDYSTEEIMNICKEYKYWNKYIYKRNNWKQEKSRINSKSI